MINKKQYYLNLSTALYDIIFKIFPGMKLNFNIPDEQLHESF